jgi:hypothetical protein
MTAAAALRLLRGLGAVGGAALVGSAVVRAQQAPSSGGSAGAPAPSTPLATKPWYALGFIDDAVMENQLLHYLACVYSQQADVGEVLDTARRIDIADRYSWPKQWVATADRVRGMGGASLSRGHCISAGHAFLRAANYYRAALIHHPEPNDPEVLEIGHHAVSHFDRAISLLGLPAQAIRIPYEGTTLPGYFWRSTRARGDAPLLIFFQGRDAWPEESKYLIDGALERGYHVLTFHGPGQGMAIREQGLPFRYDWERVVSPVVDFAVRISGVDCKRIMLMGSSMGGALSPRAAAFEHRLHILVANPGVLNWNQAMRWQFEQLFPDALALLKDDPAGFDAMIYELMTVVPLYDWYMRDSMNKHGADSPSGLLTELEGFDNTQVVHQIRCRTLVMDGTAESYSVGQGKQLYDALSCPKEYLLFDEHDTGLLHCQEAAQAVANHRMFDWVDQQL